MNVIFPMAGRGIRFGGTFKPFLPIRDELFIQAAVRPFRSWQHAIDKLVFVYLAEQEQAFDVSRRLNEMFYDLPVETVILNDPTDGPAQTVAGGIAALALHGPVIICDCDHSVDPEPIFQRIERDSVPSCLLPTWSISQEELPSWSVAAVDSSNRVAGIAEKAYPPEPGEYVGVVGCYFFANAEEVSSIIAENSCLNVSDIIQEMIKRGRHVEAAKLARAEFFGDPQRLASVLES